MDQDENIISRKREIFRVAIRNQSIKQFLLQKREVDLQLDKNEFDDWVKNQKSNHKFDNLDLLVENSHLISTENIIEDQLLYLLKTTDQTENQKKIIILESIILNKKTISTIFEKLDLTQQLLQLLDNLQNTVMNNQLDQFWDMLRVFHTSTREEQIKVKILTILVQLVCKFQNINSHQSQILHGLIPLYFNIPISLITDSLKFKSSDFFMILKTQLIKSNDKKQICLNILKVLIRFIKLFRNSYIFNLIIDNNFLIQIQKLLMTQSEFDTQIIRTHSLIIKITNKFDKLILNVEFITQLFDIEHNNNVKLVTCIQKLIYKYITQEQNSNLRKQFDNFLMNTLMSGQNDIVQKTLNLMIIYDYQFEGQYEILQQLLNSDNQNINYPCSVLLQTME